LNRIRRLIDLDRNKREKLKRRISMDLWMKEDMIGGCCISPDHMTCQDL
jgi:hypothetical protein